LAAARRARSPLVAASAAAARPNVSRSVWLYKRCWPILSVAEEAAMVDHISEGRPLFGVGRPVSESHQDTTRLRESRELFSESLEIIQRAWTEEPFSYAGKYYQFREVNVVPKPYQKPTRPFAWP
jgi:alkanesulfonate monooxygenase SsuD/methylene tetrahydromethanopterin reductase-like flavin-dependent oxidoreductase (luciferase family)